MNFDFNRAIDRKNTSCIKWDYLSAFFGREDLNPLWVADMDFEVPEEILAPIQKRAEHAVFGYTAKPDEFFTAVMGWFQKRYGWSIEKEWIVTTPGVVPALNLAIQEFTGTGDGVIIQSPVYFPFKESVELNNRKLFDNQLVLEAGRYGIDWADLEAKAALSRMLVFCSPHNPVSRVWSEDELDRLGKICSQHNLLVFSDEIHADIVFPPHRHIPTACVSSDLACRTIASYAASKTFNLAGLQMSVNIIPDEEIRERFKNSIMRLHLHMSNIFGIVGTQAAYTFGAKWLDELLVYLYSNYRKVDSYLREYIPAISVIEPDGTFLLWLDCRKLGLSDEELSALFVEKAGLALSNGILFGPGGSGFMRMNIGCPEQNLTSALENLKKALEDDSPIQAISKTADTPEDC